MTNQPTLGSNAHQWPSIQALFLRVLSRLDTMQKEVTEHFRGLTNIEAKQLIQKDHLEVEGLFPSLTECLPL